MHRLVSGKRDGCTHIMRAQSKIPSCVLSWPPQCRDTQPSCASVTVAHTTLRPTPTNNQHAYNPYIVLGLSISRYIIMLCTYRWPSVSVARCIWASAHLPRRSLGAVQSLSTPKWTLIRAKLGEKLVWRSVRRIPIVHKFGGSIPAAHNFTSALSRRVQWG